MSAQTKYERIKNKFEMEVKENFIEYLGNEEDTDDDDDLKDKFLREEYNTIPLTTNQGNTFIDRDIDVYFEMEEYCVKYSREHFGEEYTERGLVNIVTLWRYLVATEYIYQIQLIENNEPSDKYYDY